MRYLLFILIIWLWGCKSAEKVAREGATKQEAARQQEISLIEKTRRLYPCDTFRIKSTDTLLQVIPGDTVRVGEMVYIHDTAVVKRIVTKYVLDSAWLLQYQDSLASERYICDLAREQAQGEGQRADKAEASAKAAKEDVTYYKRIVIVGGVVLGLLIGGIGALKIIS